MDIFKEMDRRDVMCFMVRPPARARNLNDGPLPPDYGGPLRLLMPSKYGYKSVKTILRLEFLEAGGTAYWSKYGYSGDATIEPGTDHALDLKDYKQITRPGEPDY